MFMDKPLMFVLLTNGFWYNLIVRLYALQSRFD